MTTISNNRRRKKFSLRSLSFLLVLAILLGAGFIWRDALANLLWRGLSPVLSARNQAASASTGFFGQFSSNASLAQENAFLKEEIASTSARLMDRDYLYAENIILKQKLGRVVNQPVVLATVLMRPPGVPYGTLMLDVGKQNGVKEGDFVSSEGSAYVGRITKAYDTTSRVTLFSAPGQTYQAFLRGVVPIGISGEGSGSMKGEVPAATAVAVGDPVLFPSIMPQFMAKVSAVVDSEGQSFRTIYLVLPTNPFELSSVLVHLTP